MTPSTRTSNRGTRPARTPGSPTTGDAELARLAKALGHPVRVAILRRLLAHGECVCGKIVEGLPLAQATVSQHLKVLREAGLISGEVDGPRICYCVNPAVVKRVKELVGGL